MSDPEDPASHEAVFSLMRTVLVPENERRTVLRNPKINHKAAVNVFHSRNLSDNV